MKTATSSSIRPLVTTTPVILFDGVCNLCNGFVQLVIKHDKKANFKFASLQSEMAIHLLAATDLNPNNLNTVILVDGEKTYTHSDVAIQVGKKLGGVWRIIAIVAEVFPRTFRNMVYNWISRNRYIWFGKKETCIVPTPALKSRFL